MCLPGHKKILLRKMRHFLCAGSLVIFGPAPGLVSWAMRLQLVLWTPGVLQLGAAVRCVFVGGWSLERKLYVFFDAQYIILIIGCYVCAITITVPVL